MKKLTNLTKTPKVNNSDKTTKSKSDKVTKASKVTKLNKTPKTLISRVTEAANKYGKFDITIAKKAFKNEYETRRDSIMRTARVLVQRNILKKVGAGSYIPNN